MRISSIILSIVVCWVANAQTAQDFYKIASAKYNDKEYAAAAIDYTRAIELQPKSAVLFNNRGLCYTKIEQWDKAEEDFNASIELDPEYKQAYLNLGNLHLDKVTYDKALLAYDNALRIDSNYYVVYSKRAYAGFYLNDFKGALRDYSKAIENEPNDYVLYNARGAVYQKLGEIPQAIADYDKTLSLNPKAYETFINRGILRTQLRQYDDAIGDFTVAQSFAGMSGEGYYYRGLCRIGQLDAIRTSKEKHLVMDIKENNKLLELACSDFKKAKEFSYGRAFESFQEYCVVDKTKGSVTKVEPLADITPEPKTEVIPVQQAAASNILLSDRDKLKAELKAEIIAELVRDYELVPKENPETKPSPIALAKQSKGDTVVFDSMQTHKSDIDSMQSLKLPSDSLSQSKYKQTFSSDIAKSRYYDSAWRAVLKSFEACNFDDIAYKDSFSTAYKYGSCAPGNARAIAFFSDSSRKVDVYYQELNEPLIFGFRQEVIYGYPNGESNDMTFAMGDTTEYPDDNIIEVVSVFDDNTLVYQFNPAKTSYSFNAVLENYNKLQELIAKQ